MATFVDIGLSQPVSSTITHKLRGTSLDVNSTVVVSEVIGIGDPDSSLAAIVKVTNTTPASTAWGMVIRQGREPATYYNSTCSTVTSSASTTVYTLVAASASTRICVYAFNLASTLGLTVEFMSSGAGNGGGSTGNIWSQDLGAGVSAGNLAVTPPARLFQTAAGEALGLRMGTTGAQVRYSLSWFVE